MTGPDSERVRALNDAFRTSGFIRGGWLVTVGVQALGPALLLEAAERVKRFDRFDEDNDPHGEHDFGSFELAGETLFWKIDCYDLDRRFHSPDPGDPNVTCRVLTILLASEY